MSTDTQQGRLPPCLVHGKAKQTDKHKTHRQSNQVSTRNLAMESHSPQLTRVVVGGGWGERESMVDDVDEKDRS